MNKSVIETLVGAIVLAVAIGFGYFAYDEVDLAPQEGYQINARFSDIDGISNGSEVRIGGIKVGSVAEMELDPQTYEAIVKMQLRDGVKIPEDSSAKITSSGLLGGKFISLTPGASDEMLASHDTIGFTQSSVNIETLIGKMVHSGGGVDESSPNKDSFVSDPPFLE